MTTNAIATFASRHQKVAAGLIILSEFCNGAIGLLIGSSLLSDQPGWYLALLLGGLVVVRSLFRRYSAIRLPDLTSLNRFRFQKNSYSFLFLINILTYCVAGGISGRAIIQPEPSVSVASENSRSYSETSTKDSVSSYSPTRPGSQTVVTPDQEKPRSGSKVGYFLLFLASLPLSFLAGRLACNLACSSQGFAAVLVFLLGTGVLAGGFYFLGRALDKNMKPYKAMSKVERKREGKRYLRALLGTVAGLLVFSLIISLTK